MSNEELLAGQALLEAIEKSGKDRYPDLPQIIQDSIAAIVPAEDRLRGLKFVIDFLKKESKG